MLTNQHRKVGNRVIVAAAELNKGRVPTIVNQEPCRDQLSPFEGRSDFGFGPSLSPFVFGGLLAGEGASGHVSASLADQSLHGSLKKF